METSAVNQEGVKKEKCRWLKKEALSIDALVVSLAILVAALIISFVVESPQMGTKGVGKPTEK